FTATGKQVATSKVHPDGFFRADAPTPSRSIRYTSRARYVAIVGGDQSMPLKLHCRMRISRMRHVGNTVHLAGRVYGQQRDAPVPTAPRRDAEGECVMAATASTAAPAVVRDLVSDERRARLAARGDERAFGTLFSLYRPDLERYCRSILRNGADADDAAQNAF